MTTNTNYVTDAPQQHNTRDGVAWMTHIYLDGKKLAMVENSGRGGCDEYEWFGNTRADIVAVEEPFFNAAKAWNLANRPDDTPEGGYEDICKFGGLGDYASMYLEHLMQVAELNKKLRRDCKKMICIRRPGQSQFEYSFFKNMAPTAENIARVKAKFPDATILN